MAGYISDIGPAQVLFDETDVGFTHAVTVNFTEETADHMTAQHGSSAKDKIYTGETVTVEVNLTEPTKTQLAALIPNSTTDGNEVMIGSGVGTSMRANAAHLVIKPYEDGAASETAADWYTFFVAAPVPEFSFPFDADTDREYKVTFHCFKATEVASGESYAVGDIYAIGYGETA